MERLIPGVRERLRQGSVTQWLEGITPSDTDDKRIRQGGKRR